METLILILFAAAGVVIHICIKFRDALTKKDEGVTFKQFFKAYQWGLPLVVGGISLVIAIVLILIRNEDGETAGFPITKETAVVLGYMADSIWKNVQSKWTTAN